MTIEEMMLFIGLMAVVAALSTLTTAMFALYYSKSTETILTETKAVLEATKETTTSLEDLQNSIKATTEEMDEIIDDFAMVMVLEIGDRSEDEIKGAASWFINKHKRRHPGRY